MPGYCLRTRFWESATNSLGFLVIIWPIPGIKPVLFSFSAPLRLCGRFLVAKSPMLSFPPGGRQNDPERWLQEVAKLSDADKPALIEVTAQMLRQAANKNGVQSVESVAEVAAPYRVDESDTVNTTAATRQATLALDVQEYYLAQGRCKLAAFGC